MISQLKIFASIVSKVHEQNSIVNSVRVDDGTAERAIIAINEKSANH